MTKIEIRKLNANDLRTVLDLFARHIKVEADRMPAFRRRLFLSCMSGMPFGLLGEDILIGSVAETDNGHIIGTILARRFPFGKSWIIGPVFVHPNFRGSDTATGMMKFTVGHLRRKKARWAILSVATNNIQARRVFEKSKFEYLGPVFTNHDQARKYVQMLTLISGYLQNTDNIKQYPLQTKIAPSDRKPETNRLRTWHIMLRQL